MKAVLMSIQPKWVEKIASGKKTIEVRKTRPKIATPFKVYIYETKGKKVECGFHFEETGRTLREKYVFGMREAKIVKHYRNEGQGKVIGEFVCDAVIEFTKAFFDEQEPQDTEEIDFYLDQFQIPYNELCSYADLKDFYGWRISDLKIYDKPKELSEFKLPCTQKQCASWCKDMKVEKAICLNKGKRFITRPPQSWCYVEVAE